MSSGTVCLMYHELELPGRRLCQSEEGYVRYVVSLETFRSQLKVLRDAGLTGISVSQMLDGKRGVAITFDDGCETDVLAAAPLLRVWLRSPRCEARRRASLPDSRPFRRTV